MLREDERRLPLTALRAVGTAFLRRRPRIVAPAMVLVLLTLALTGAPWRQIAVLAAGFTVMLTFFVSEALAARSGPFEAERLSRSLLLTQLGIGLSCLATGAASSPFVPLLFAPAGTAFAAFGRTAGSVKNAIMLAVVVALLALAPRELPFPVPGTLAFRLMLVVVVTTAARLLHASVTGLIDAYARASDALDRTREALLEESAAAPRELEALGARVAHEIKNPLSSIRGLVELMAQQAGDEPRQARRYAVVLGEIDRIDAIVGDYLRHARPLAATQRTAVDLRTLLEDVAGLVSARAASAGVELVVRGEPVTVSADARRLREAVLNLVTNALEASRPESLVTLALHDVGSHVDVSVEDEGAGMPVERLARLGTPFETGREEGTGLGVHLARAVFEAHGGTLTYRSSEGRGTVATARFPKGPTP